MFGISRREKVMPTDKFLAICETQRQGIARDLDKPSIEVSEPGDSILIQKIIENGIPVALEQRIALVRA